MESKLIRGTAEDGQLRYFIGETTALVEEARRIHETTAVSSAALGRVLTGAALMGWMMKGKKDRLTLQVRGSGEIRHIIAVSDAEGQVKGYVSNTKVPNRLNDRGKLDVGGAIGQGKLLVIQDMGLKEPYMGQSNLVSGEIAEDLAAYFMYSKQEPSVVSLGVFVERDHSIGAAGGFIIQPMPDCNPLLIDILEDHVRRLPPVTDIIKQTGGNVRTMTDLILAPFEHRIGDLHEAFYRCDCSREKVEGAIVSMGREEIEKLINEDGQAEVTCHFCNKRYLIDETRLKSLLDEAVRP